MSSPAQFGPPIDLSHLSAYKSHATKERKIAFLGRVSTKDNQNPASSIPRQVSLAAERLEQGEKFVAYFWDVESGMLPPELRGLGTSEAYEEMRIPTRRDGGLQDLLQKASGLRITHVIAERSDRVARAMLTSLTVEHELRSVGVDVVYANEPVGGTESGRLRARLYSQADAEIYRTVMVEMSTGGQIQHTLGGWNHGVPPYPYVAVVDENAPAPKSRRFGPQRPKRKLVPHPDSRRFKAAQELVRLRREERLKTGDIIGVLSSYPDLYPVENRWTHKLVDGLLSNPKLTGYQVYNRRANRTSRPGLSRWNPISEWIWSPEMVHEPVMTVQEWAEVQVITDGLRRSAVSGMARVREASKDLGLVVTKENESDSHTLYRIGTRRMVLPRGELPDVVVDQVIEDLRSAS